MRKYVFRIWPVLFSICFVNTVFTQQIDSMMNVYAERAAPEKIHVHFDKTIYNRGDTVWYKVYILQGSDTTASSTNVYFDWYASDGKLMRHTASPVLLSTSQGSFEIPADYKGESLKVWAFTNWTLNDPGFAYHRELKVNTNNTKTTKTEQNKTTVETFPESGFLIQGLNTRVAFKATNQYGNPVFIKGVLADDKNNILDSLNVAHDGMGSFFITPLPSQLYKLNWIDENGITGSTPIPVTKTEGARITIKRTNTKALFEIERTENVPENFKKMTLVVHMNRVGLYQVAINTSEKTKLSSEIPINDLPTGLLQFTLFTADWIPVAERVTFINNRLHEFDVEVTTPLINLEKRGKNAIEIFVPDTLFTNMSLSITDAVVSPPDQHTIFSDVLLSSDIRGKVFNPAYYLSANSDSVAAHLDLVMLTNGWRRFNWDRIMAHIAPTIEYPVETEYMKLKGKVPGMKRNSPAMEYPLVIFDTSKVFYSVNNNKSLTEKMELQISNGLLNWPHKNIEAFSSDPGISNSPAKQKLDMILSQQELLRKLMAEATLKEVTVTTRVKTKLEQLNEKYTSAFFSGNGARRSYAFDLVNEPNLIIAQTQSVLSYLQNRVSGLFVNCSSMLNCQVGWTRGGTPDFYLNEMNVPLETILAITINDIALVKAFPPPFVYSSSGMRGGAIAVYTKKMEDYKQPEIKGLPNTLLAGYSKFAEFYSPSYEEPNKSLPKTDNRTTLYWTPNLITNQTQQRVRIDFFNNDFTKTFNVVLEGINAAGKMTRVVKTIDANTKVD
jgi:hypothetical protein